MTVINLTGGTIRASRADGLYDRRTNAEKDNERAGKYRRGPSHNRKSAPPLPTQGAACAGQPTEWWFPNLDPGNALPPSGHHAVDICTECPIRQACYEYALQGDTYGIWGGVLFSGERRRAIKRHERLEIRIAQKRAAAPPSPGKPGHGHGGYTRGCRCDTCVQAKRDYNRVYMAAARAQEKKAEAAHV